MLGFKRGRVLHGLFLFFIFKSKKGVFGMGIMAWIGVAVTGAISAILSQVIQNSVVKAELKKDKEE